ncbi:hypothetical protein [Calothrix sp. UHCC 0171]|uniref:hypothetical protein n=1 Tax=Calothrix sp. UHCC 0171 TaxID=3110245 RepID=UPI002B1EEF37|nr:hypothetical protein [Calothrix sp. UHCC 0171]MEA5574601.1 hypothetical protein [Calothrix sp. UHCC 0171]
MSNANNKQLSACPTICNECISHTFVEGLSECLHPDESGVNCATVIFCSSFQPIQQVDSPCISFGEDEEDRD